jgi:U4/U6.U5 tri-snRNP component SNU23
MNEEPVEPAAKRSKGKAGFVDNTARRTWDKEDYAKKEDERERREAAEEVEAERAKDRRQLVQRENLVLTGNRAEGKLDLTRGVGTRQMINAGGHKSQLGGWYCDVCEGKGGDGVLLRDSASYLDHINGKKHQRALGMKMTVERSSLAQVKAKLEQDRVRTNVFVKKTKTESAQDLEDAVNAQLEREAGDAQRRKEKRQAKRDAAAKEEVLEVDDETRAMAEAMGMPMSFGSSKN